MTEHTPGPWEKKYDPSTHRIEVNAPDDGRCVCFIHVPPATGFDVCEANARLIAAAPETAAERDRLREINAELLAALSPLLEGWQAFKDSHGNQTDAYYKLAKGQHAAWEKVAFICAKAKGQG